MIVAIGTDGRRPVVWGIGSTTAAAIDDAWQQSCGSWDDQGSATCEVTADVATRVWRGEVACESLGIVVEVRRGEIVGAHSAVRP